VAPPIPTLARESAAWAADRLLIGIDEAGRGPLAGPVVAAAVVFPRDVAMLAGVRDSKTLSASRRDRLAPALRTTALLWALGAASCREIDSLNIRVATILAMRRALERVLSRLGATPCEVLVDGLPVVELGHSHQALVGGDAHCYTIAAAGILAKTLRDDLMQRLARRYPPYGWDRNMGYGTARHLAALTEVGPCAHHRRSFAPVSQLTLLR